ncbi:MAG TPA: alpha/beta fold hydrolase [Acidimicrobiales bacterium]|nr:alpha/beta fold hydrolase [Acidimicrobiales bacterium]
MTTATAPRPGVPIWEGALGSLGAAITSPARWARRRRPGVRMVPSVLHVGSRHLHFAVSDNEDAHGPDGPGSDPVWAVNVHGYFAGGRMYWRESAHLAEELGWRVVNPCLPGFGGSDPLGWHEVSVGALAEHIAYVVDHLDAGPVVLLGHSMGGAVAVQYAHDRPEQTLGVVYRDGVATPAWRDRHGPVQTVIGAVSPNMAPFADLAASFVADVPDLLIGRLGSTFLTVLPDVRRNVRTMGLTLPLGAMLLTVDLRDEVVALADAGVPMLAAWGSFDRIVGASTADEFARYARTTVQWVPGGHSWMLARPQGQADVLTRLESGRRFVSEVLVRRRHLSDPSARRGSLRRIR